MSDVLGAAKIDQANADCLRRAMSRNHIAAHQLLLDSYKRKCLIALAGGAEMRFLSHRASP